MDINVHYERDHHTPLAYESRTFGSAAEFENWRDNLFRETFCIFEKRFSYQNSELDCWRYICHRSGSYLPKMESRRFHSYCKSKRLAGHCPAEIDVTFNKSSRVYDVKYQTVHVGHQVGTAEELKWADFSAKEKKAAEMRSDGARMQTDDAEMKINFTDVQTNLSGMRMPDAEVHAVWIDNSDLHMDISRAETETVDGMQMSDTEVHTVWIDNSDLHRDIFHAEMETADDEDLADEQTVFSEMQTYPAELHASRDEVPTNLAGMQVTLVDIQKICVGMQNGHAGAPTNPIKMPTDHTETQKRNAKVRMDSTKMPLYSEMQAIYTVSKFDEILFKNRRQKVN